jgi:CelD/BcsL family acetyltransferase involved in cellulose biosynthesis
MVVTRGLTAVRCKGTPEPLATKERVFAIDPAFEIVTDPDRFLALRAEWDALWARTATRRFTQSFDWCMAAWRTTGAPRGRALRIVVMRQDGQAVLIWPMTVGRLGLWRLAGALGPEASEYDPVLVQSGPEAGERLRTAWRFVRRHCRADIVKIPFVRGETVLHRILGADGVRCDAKTLACPFVVWEGTASWEDYWRSRGTELRRCVSRRRRRLAKTGTVTCAVIDDPAALREVIDWTIAAKIDWLDRKRQTNDFLPKPEFRDFLRAVAAAPPHSGRLVAFVLRLDGRTIAAQIAAIDDFRYEMFITVYDPAFAAYSPGQLLLADAMRWCQEQCLTYDFRIGAEAYKYAWANGDCPATTYHIAATPWGALMLAGHAVRQRWRATLGRMHGTPSVAT